MIFKTLLSPSHKSSKTESLDLRFLSLPSSLNSLCDKTIIEWFLGIHWKIIFQCIPRNHSIIMFPSELSIPGSSWMAASQQHKVDLVISRQLSKLSIHGNVGARFWWRDTPPHTSQLRLGKSNCNIFISSSGSSSVGVFIQAITRVSTEPAECSAFGIY